MGYSCLCPKAAPPYRPTGLYPCLSRYFFLVLPHRPVRVGVEVGGGVDAAFISITWGFSNMHLRNACVFAFCHLTECHHYGQERDSRSRDENQLLFTEYFWLEKHIIQCLKNPMSIQFVKTYKDVLTVIISKYSVNSKSAAFFHLYKNFATITNNTAWMSALNTPHYHLLLMLLQMVLWLSHIHLITYIKYLAIHKLQ